MCDVKLGFRVHFEIIKNPDRSNSRNPAFEAIRFAVVGVNDVETINFAPLYGCEWLHDVDVG